MSAETELVAEVAMLREENTDLRMRLEACHRIMEQNSAELPEFVAKICRPLRYHTPMEEGSK